MQVKKFLFFLSLGFFFLSKAEVSFSQEEALIRKDRIEVLVSQTKIKSNIAKGVLAISGVLVAHYYFPNVFPNLPEWLQRTPIVTPGDGAIVSADLMEKIKGMIPQFSKEQVDILKQLADNRAEEIGKQSWTQSTFNWVKGVYPVVLGSFLVTKIDAYRSALVNACFPNISLSWFIQSQTRIVYFGLILEENVKLLQQERDKEKITSLELLTNDALECFVDYAASVVGYMYWRAENTLKDNQFMGQKLHNLADATSKALTSFCVEMNALLASREGHIGLLGRVDSFSEELDYNLKMFMICENEILAPIGQRRSDASGESYKDSLTRIRKRMFSKTL